jgi:hypothetical protein
MILKFLAMEIVENLESALEQFRAVCEEFGVTPAME